VELRSDNGRIFCTKCGDFRGDTPDVGLICLWHGKVSTIPPGWQLCDGTNDTPDLRDKFVVGGGGGYTPGSKGGSIHSKLTLVNIPSHNHFKNVDKKSEIPIAEETIELGSSNNRCVVVETRTVAKEPYCKKSGCQEFPRCCGKDGGYMFEQYQRNGHGLVTPKSEIVYTRPTHYSETGAAGALDPKPFDTRPPYYALAYIMRVK
jgi:microcystin-dependent protein